MLTRRRLTLGFAFGLSLTLPAYPQGAVPEGLSFYERFEFDKIYAVREDRPTPQKASAPAEGKPGEAKKELVVRPALEVKGETTTVAEFGEKPAPAAQPAEAASQPGEKVPEAPAPQFVPQAAELNATEGILVLYGRGGLEFIESEKKHTNIPYKAVTGMFYEFTPRPAWLGPAPEPVEEKKGWKQKLVSVVKFEGVNPKHYLTIRYMAETGPEVLILRIDSPDRAYLLQAIEAKTGKRADRTRSGVMLASASKE